MAYLSKTTFVITDVANYTVKEIKQLIKDFRKENPEHEGLAKRSDKSYLNEWAVHALAFRWNVLTERSKNADMQFNLRPEIRFMYNVLGPIARLILKFYR